jgi:xanthine dehydrogenase accessory factor
MTHEFKNLIQDYIVAKSIKQNVVLATVVDLDGSSYRRPGVRMLIREDGKISGAVSGGCVEKEVFRQAQSVFETGSPRLMTYDGRYRLGCEGILYILIEAFNPDPVILEKFQESIEERRSFHIKTVYSKAEGEQALSGSMIIFGDSEKHPFSSKIPLVKASGKDLLSFEQEMKPPFKLFIFGTEHDAVQLTHFSNRTGWEVTVVGSIKDPKSLEDFPGAKEILHLEASEIPTSIKVDNTSAIILMAHSYVTDLKHLMALKDSRPAYIGLLGPGKRREKLLNEFIEQQPDIEEDFLDVIHGPAGINIGAETPQEIAISIISEILSVIRNQKPMQLKDKKGRIHSDIKL